MTTAAVAALALGGASACVSETPFLCTDSAQCISDGEGGTCESTGFCSFEDAECESGRRYGKAAGDGLANECVEGGVGGCAGNLSLTAGSDHTCAFDSTGTVSCWGADYGGQLGDGHELRDHSTPQPVPLVPPVIEIDAGRAHTCAVTREAELYCWGDNSDGQLGGTGNRALPVAVATDVAQVAAGGDTTCFVNTGAQVLCLGDNLNGEIGNNSVTDQPTPLVVEGLSNVAQVDVGSAHTCARTLDGSVFCWGANSSGQLGDGTLEPKRVPTPVPGLVGIVELALGDAHSCARGSDGEVTCWGSNLSGQLGDGTVVDRPDPTVVNNVVAEGLLANGRHTCAVTDGNVLSCWGENGSGQLGDLSKEDRSAPVPISFPVAARQSVALGSGHTCAQDDQGALHCWGSDVSGQLAIDSLMRSDVPVQANGVSGAMLIAAGGGHSCAVLTSGAVQCWGEANDGELGVGSSSRVDMGPADTEDIVAADAIIAAGDRTCVHEAGDTVSCWGGLDNGVLGSGSSSDSYSPNQVNTTLIVAPTAITLGSVHSCATTTMGDVYCWGSNTLGQQGNGNISSSTTARLSTAVTMPALVAAGDRHTCAVDGVGATLCWGAGDQGELGDGLSTSTGAGPPVTVTIATPTAMALGDSHSCALLADATVSCWGANDEGQTGAGTDTLSEPAPVAVSGLAGVAEISSDEDHTCARLTDGTVWCWGENDEGELGAGSAEESSSIPLQVQGINAISIAAGSDHACAVATDNTVWCWGDNTDAQLDGRQVRFLEPQATTLTCR